MATDPQVGEIWGEVRDETGRGLPGAALSLRSLDAGARRSLGIGDGPLLSSAPADGDGRFRLPCPAPPPLRLWAQAPGRARAARLIEAGSGPFVLTLVAEARLELLLTRADGAPVGAARVELRLPEAVLALDLGAGASRLDGLPPGPAAVRVSAEDGAEGVAGPLELRSGETTTARLVLEPPAVVAGTVRAEDDGSPVPGVGLWLVWPGRSRGPYAADAQGRFGPLPAGREPEPPLLAVRAPGFADALLPSGARPGGERWPLDLRLSRAAAWAGRVEQPDGAPAVGARVRYTSDGVAGRAPAAARTDEQGVFRLPPPPPPAPGRQVLLLAESAAGLAALPLRPGQAAPEPLVLRLAAGAFLRGRLVDGDGAPLPGALVRARPADDGRTPGSADLLRGLAAAHPGGLVAATDAEGRWTLAGLGTGAYRLTLEGPQHQRTLPETVLVGPAGLDLGTQAVGGGLALSGRVLDARGRPAAGVRVSLSPDGAPAPAVSATSGPDGRFSLADLGPGAYRLEARGPGGGAGGGALSTRVTLPAETHVELALPPQAGLELRVEDARGAWSGLLGVRLAPAGRGLPGPGPEAHLSVQDGRARWEGLPEGRFRLWARAGPAGAASAPATPPPLLAVLEVETVTGRLSAAALRLEPGAALSGTVRSASGRPVGRGSVRLTPADGGAPLERALSGEGAFAFEGLPPGAYGLTATGEGGAPSSRELTLTAGARDALELALLPAGSLRVRVLDAGGHAVAGARLTARPLGGGRPPARPPYTDAQGWALVRDLPVGPARLGARTAAGAGAEARVEVVAGETRDVVLTLPAPR